MPRPPVSCQTQPSCRVGFEQVVITAPPGAGKTLAYAVSVLTYELERRTAASEDRQAVRAVFLLPTRELAQQVEAVLQVQQRLVFQVLAVFSPALCVYCICKGDLQGYSWHEDCTVGWRRPNSFAALPLACRGRQLGCRHTRTSG
jgi:hypothetical protein